MKVAEAKQKVCPFIQSTTATNDRSCSDYNTHKNINCICGDCMAWAWFPLSETGLSKDKEGYCLRIGQ